MMKKLIVPVFCCLAFMTAPAFAQKPGAPHDVSDTEPGAPTVIDNHQRTRGQDRPVAPVPEPGTMALASMGLIALGAAARKRGWKS